MGDLHTAGFKELTRLADARERLFDVVRPHERTERLPLSIADGRVLSEPIDAGRAVPHYTRASMDGYAVRACDTFGASNRSPAVLSRHDDGAGAADEPREPESRGAERGVAPGEAIRVHTGSELPEGANAVVMIERVENDGTDLTVFDAVAEGENAALSGEDVAEGQRLLDAGHRLRPSDLGLLKSTGIGTVPVYERPTVGVIPTGEELVQADPAPGEVIETNGLTVSQYVDRWGGEAQYRNIVTDDREALRAAIQRDLPKDIVVTTGGSSVGERDLLPEVVEGLGEVLVHGVALRPGHPVALGVIEKTPVIVLPGYPVACIVNAVQFLRPALKRIGGLPIDPHPTTRARLARKVRSEPGSRTFARVRLERSSDGEGRAVAGSTAADTADAAGIEREEGDGEIGTIAEPTRAGGAGVLSSVAFADGWVTVPEEREGFASGEIVDVDDWEWSP